MMEYIKYMNIRELRERKAELENYIDSGCIYLYDNSIVLYPENVIDNFIVELKELNAEINNRIASALVKISSLAL